MCVTSRPYESGTKIFVQVPGEILSAEMYSSWGRWSGAKAGWMRLTGQEGKNSAQIRAVVEEASAGVRIRRRVRRCCDAVRLVSC
jgi:hypothetical protein